MWVESVVCGLKALIVGSFLFIVGLNALLFALIVGSKMPCLQVATGRNNKLAKTLMNSFPRVPRNFLTLFYVSILHKHQILSWIVKPFGAFSYARMRTSTRSSNIHSLLAIIGVKCLARLENAKYQMQQLPHHGSNRNHFGLATVQ